MKFCQFKFWGLLVIGLILSGCYPILATAASLNSGDLSLPDKLDAPVYQPIKMDSYQGAQFKVKDEITDVANLSDGKMALRLYTSPRSLEKMANGELKLRPKGWNLFNEDTRSKINRRSDSGYEYLAPWDDQAPLKVFAGNVDIGDKTIYVPNAGRLISTNQDGSTNLLIANVYPNIDILFKDVERSRSREIYIKKVPDNLNQNDTVVFWENYQLPEGAKVMVGSDELSNGEKEYDSDTFVIKSPSGAMFLVGNALAYDSREDSSDYRDLTMIGLKRIAVVDYSQHIFKIGIKMPASYLLDKTRVYPVVIDPIYNVCGDSGCSIVDMYFRLLNGADQTDASGAVVDNAELFTGLYAASASSKYTRHAVIYFGQNFQTLLANATVSEARLYLSYANYGSGLATYSYITADRITTYWDTSNPTGYRYSNFKSGLVQDNGSATLNKTPIGINHYLDVAGTILQWKYGQPNYGFLIQPYGLWSDSSIPAGWQNLLLKYDSSAVSGSKPYLELILSFKNFDGTNLTVNNGTVAAGGQLTGTFSIYNSGDQTTAATTVGYYLYLGACNWNYFGSNRIGTGSLASLPGYGSVNLNYNVTVPANTSPGTYCLAAKADDSNSVVEFYEDDNGSYYGNISVTASAKPDLTKYSGSSLTISPSSYYPGDMISVSPTIINSGNANAGSSYTYFYFNKDSISYSANNVDQIYAAGLSANYTASADLNYTIPANTVAGTYYLSFYIDGGNAVTESNESNNQFAYSAITVASRPYADLNINTASISDTSLHWSGQSPAQTISATARVRNLGTVAANGVGFSMELVGGSQSYPLSNVAPSVASFAAGYDNTISLTGTIPSGMPYYGQYYLRVKIDPNNNIIESNDGNNSYDTANSLYVMQYYISGGGGGGTPAPDSDNDGLNDLAEVICGTAISAQDRVNCYKRFPEPYFSKPTDKLNEGADPVNLRNGALELEAPDFRVTNGQGFQLDYTRTYNSKLFDRNARLGRGWSHSYNIYYYQDSSSKNVQVYLGGARASVFTTSDGGNTFTAPAGETEIFYKDGTNFVYRTQDGQRYIFSQNTVNDISMVSQIIDPNSNTLTFAYSDTSVTRSVPLLTSVTDSSGRTLSFIYPSDVTTSTWDKVMEVRESLSGVDRLVAKYTYNVIDANSIDLASVTNYTYFEGSTQTLTHNYVYVSDGKLLTYTNATAGTVLTNEYDVTGRVTKQYETNPRLGAGDKRLIYNISYSDSADPNVSGSTHCTMLDNYRATSSYYSEKLCFNSSELRIYRERGTNVEHWAYDSNGMPSQYTDANGNVTGYTYDTKRRLVNMVKPDANGWHNTVVNTYEDTHNRLLTSQETAVKTADGTTLERTWTNAYDSRGNLVTSTDYLEHPEIYTYDAHGNVLSITNRNGQVMRYLYNGTGYRTSEDTAVTNADDTIQSIIKQYGYNNYGQRTSYIDPNHYTYTYTYDSQGQLRRETNPESKNLTFHYDALGHKDWQSDQLGRVTRFVYDTDLNASLLTVTQESAVDGNIVNRREYDWQGNVIKEIDPAGNETVFIYNNANQLDTKSDGLKTATYSYYPNGLLESEIVTANDTPTVTIKKTWYYYDSRGNKVEERRFIDASNYISLQWEYDGLGRNIKQIDGNGNVTLLSYDLADRLYSKTDAASGTARYYYDNVGNKTAELTPRADADGSLRNSYGKSFNYYYDAANRLIKVVNVEDKISENYYDANGNLIKVVDRKNYNGTGADHVTQYTYDNLNRKTAEIYADGAQVSWDYYDNGQIRTKTDAMERATAYTYDDFGRLVGETAPGNFTTGYKYDSRGNKTEVDYPDSTKTVYGYDQWNRLRTVTDALNNVRAIIYDAVGNRLSEVDKRSVTTSYAYDWLERVQSETNAAGTVTNYTYDNNGNQLSVTVGGTKTTSYQYDALNRVTQIIYPGNRVEKWTYDANGNQATYTDGNNLVTTFDYDKVDQLVVKHLPNSVNINYGYDQWNNLTNLTDESGSAEYTYDTLNRVIRERKNITGLVENQIIERTYYADGQLKTLTDVGGRVLTYNYNNRGLLENVSFSGSVVAAYTYTPLGKPQKVTFGNGVTIDYAYDNLNRVHSIETKNSSSTLFKEQYQYDAESNRTSVISLNGREIQYGYDNLGQLTTVDYTNVGTSADVIYAYDKWGNRTSVTSSYGKIDYLFNANTNELSQAFYNIGMVITSTYNGNGALATEVYKKSRVNIMNVNYVWDAQSRLTGINYHYINDQVLNRPDNNLSYVYDDFGNRVKKTVNGVSTYYFNNGLSVLNEITASGTVSKLMVYGVEPVAEITASGTIQYIHTDVLGSTVLVTNSAGQPVAKYEYEPFGLTMGYAGTYDTNYLFTGQEFDPESELYYYNARYYNPALGRFISRDPSLGRMGKSLSRNGYIYVLNNPLKYTDPTGGVPEARQVELAYLSNDWANSLSQTNNSTLSMCPAGSSCSNFNPFAILDYLPFSGDFSDIYALYTGNTLFGQTSLTPGQQDMIGAYAMLPALTAGQGRLIGEVAEGADKTTAKGAQVAGHILEGVPQAAMDRLMARLEGLRVGTKSVIEKIEAFGSRTTGWSNRRNGPVSSNSDLDILLHIPLQMNEGRNRGWINGVLDEVAKDFKNSTGFEVSLHNPEDGVKIFQDSVYELDPLAKFINLFTK